MHLGDARLLQMERSGLAFEADFYDKKKKQYIDLCFISHSSKCLQIYTSGFEGSNKVSSGTGSSTYHLKEIILYYFFNP